MVIDSGRRSPSCRWGAAETIIHRPSYTARLRQRRARRLLLVAVQPGARPAVFFPVADLLNSANYFLGTQNCAIP